MNIALIVAAGESKRMTGKVPKVLLPIFGKPILYYTLANFYDHPDVDRIVIVVSKKVKKKISQMVKENFPGDTKKIRLVLGGKSRSESVMNGFAYIKKYLRPKKKDILIVHNGVNPLVTFDEIRKCIKSAKGKGACIVAHSVKDTLKEVKKKKVVKTHKREKYVNAQTPQAFQFDVFGKALIKVGQEYLELTDEACLVEKAGFKVTHIRAADENFKITTKKDYDHARHLMGDLPDNYLLGIGQDSHAVSGKKGLVLGGVRFADDYKLEANSDGDVLLHALCNGLLQAIGEKSLGTFANDLCLKKKIKDSKKYLNVALRKVKRKGYMLNNLGVMIECKRPKIDKVSQKIKESLSKLTGLSEARIGITATSGEKLTSFGKGKGIQCFCIVSLKKV